MNNFKNYKKFFIEQLSKKSSNASQEFVFLCEALLNIKNSDLITKTVLTKKEEKVLNKALKQRLKGVPLQLIIGYSKFYNIDIIESKHTLKPRPETEIIVETIINNENKNSSVLDMCTGSGCIGLSLKNVGFKEVDLSDISKKALKMCKKNAQLNNLKVEIIRSNMFQNINKKYDIIVINPPYIKSEDIDNLSVEVKKYDPIKALDGGIDGLDFYRIIADESHIYLNDNGVLYIEIGKNQENDIIKLLQNHFKNIKIIKDYNEINRIIRAEKC